MTGVARSAVVPGSAAPRPLPDLKVRILVTFRLETPEWGLTGNLYYLLSQGSVNIPTLL